MLGGVLVSFAFLMVGFCIDWTKIDGAFIGPQ